MTIHYHSLLFATVCTIRDYMYSTYSYYLLFMTFCYSGVPDTRQIWNRLSVDSMDVEIKTLFVS